MSNFTTKQPTTTTATSTTPRWTFTFNTPTGTQPQNVFGASNAPQVFQFRGSAQNTPAINPFGNPSPSKK